MPESHSAQRFLSALTQLCTKGCIDSRKFKEDNDISSERTLSRFIKDFKEFVPVEYDRAKKVYVKTNTDANDYSDMLDMFSTLRTNEEMFFFYSFVKSMIKSGSFLPPVSTSKTNDSEYDSILRKLEKLIDPNDAGMHSKIEYYCDTDSDTDNKVHFNKVFSEIFKSFKTDRLLNIIYKSRESAVQPVKIIRYNERWYLAALKCNDNNKPAVYELAAVDYIKVSDSRASYNVIEPDSSEFIKLIERS
jgi:predicted DNA-binding transcriptional regulator YafY